LKTLTSVNPCCQFLKLTVWFLQIKCSGFEKPLVPDKVSDTT
jgi:hypothetical protein